MTGLLEDVLLIGKAEANKLEFNPVNINLENLCRAIVEEAEPSRRARIDFSFRQLMAPQPEPIRLADEKLLRHILSNLLSNALKYSPENARVNFEVSLDEKAMTFTVRDQGIGIVSSDMPRLFELFHRGENVGAVSGTGLGMAIVKKSVSLHGGTIKVESLPGKGTSFFVSLPVSQ